jgi:hypothetical protein
VSNGGRGREERESGEGGREGGRRQRERVRGREGGSEGGREGGRWQRVGEDIPPLSAIDSLYMRPEATSVCGLKLLVYEALS